MIFDTDCVLCSASVLFVLRHEKAPTIRFVGAWSETGLRLAAEHGLSPADLDETFLLIENGRGFCKSDAGLIVARHLKAPWSWLAALRVMPRPVRDALYSTIARRRYRWFGHKPQCFRPPSGMADRFVNH